MKKQYTLTLHKAMHTRRQQKNSIAGPAYPLGAVWQKLDDISVGIKQRRQFKEKEDGLLSV